MGGRRLDSRLRGNDKLLSGNFKRKQELKESEGMTDGSRFRDVEYSIMKIETFCLIIISIFPLWLRKEAENNHMDVRQEEPR
jgi:hypothetical protein